MIELATLSVGKIILFSHGMALSSYCLAST
jgi:hypothetical protein